MTILYLHDLRSLSPKVRYFARPGPPFVIRSVLIGWGWGCPGLQMVDLSERENRLWGRERGDRSNIEYSKQNMELGGLRKVRIGGITLS